MGSIRFSTISCADCASMAQGAKEFFLPENHFIEVVDQRLAEKN